MHGAGTSQLSRSPSQESLTGPRPLHTAGLPAPAGTDGPPPGVIKKLAALTFNGAEAFATVSASWGLRPVLMAAYVASAVALIDAIRAENGRGPLKEDVGTNMAVQALLASVSSTAAAPVLGAVHGMALNVTQLLRAVINLATRGCKSIDSKSPHDFVLNNITNPRLRMLTDDLVTAGFTALVFSRGIHSAVASGQLPLNMQPGHISGASSFDGHPGALGSAIVGCGAYLIASVVCRFKDGELMLGAPPALTLRGAQERVQMRSLAASDAFTAPLKGSRGHLSVPVLLGVSGGVSALMAAHEHDMNPYVAGIVNGGLAGLAFLTIAHEWGTKKVRHEMSGEQVHGTVSKAPQSQLDRWVALQEDHDQHQLDRWTKAPLKEWLGDQVVQTVHAMVSGGMVSAYVGSMVREHAGASPLEWQHTGEDMREWSYTLMASGVCFAGASLLTRGMQMLSPGSKQPPESMQTKLDDKGLTPGPDRDQSWADGMMPTLVGSVVIGGVAAAGGLTLGAAMGLGTFNALVSRLDPLGAAQRAYQHLCGRESETREPVGLTTVTDIALHDFKSPPVAFDDDKSHIASGLKSNPGVRFKVADTSIADPQGISEE